MAGHLTVAQGLLFGLKVAVLAVVLEALIRISRRALKGRLMVGLAVAAFLAILIFGVPFPVVVLAAALVGIIADRFGPAVPLPGGILVAGLAVPADLPDWARPSTGRFVSTLLSGLPCGSARSLC